MELSLSQEEIRILGCLIEKKMATPEYYPLSLNALINACNQKSNRSPVMALDEETVREGIEGLSHQRLVFQSHLSRVPKYEESFVNENDLVPSEAAILCVLMLRSAQTAGEIRARTERLYSFDNLDHVTRIIEQLASRNLVAPLPRQPGRKEIRFMHTMGGPVDVSADEPEVHVHSPSADPLNQTARIETLEQKVDELSAEIEALKQLFFDFKKQFD